MLLYNLFDIFMVMYLGNEVKLSSNLSYRLFESQWMVQTETCKKYIVIVAEIVKKPRELKVGKIYSLNLQTFSSVSAIKYFNGERANNFRI